MTTARVIQMAYASASTAPTSYLKKGEFALFHDTDNDDNILYLGKHSEDSNYTLFKNGVAYDSDKLDAQEGTYYLDCGNFTGALADARLSSNVPLKDGTETISGTYTFSNTISGNIDGSSASCTGNAATATAWATGRTISLTGDATGTSGSFDGSGNASITVTITDDSHNHIIGNVDGLQTALDAKAPLVSPTFTTSASCDFTPTAGTHLCNKTYVDNIAVGLSDWKASVQRATTASDGNLALNALHSVDGSAVSADDRVLVKNQTDASENGIYIAADGAWSRATDADSDSEVTLGMFVYVESGTINAGAGFVLSGKTDVLGTGDLTFSQFNGASGVTEGHGIDITGNSVAVDETELTSSLLPLVDTGTYFTTDNVEAALQEVASTLSISGGTWS